MPIGEMMERKLPAVRGGKRVMRQMASKDAIYDSGTPTQGGRDREALRGAISAMLASGVRGPLGMPPAKGLTMEKMARMVRQPRDRGARREVGPEFFGQMAPRPQGGASIEDIARALARRRNTISSAGRATRQAHEKRMSEGGTGPIRWAVPNDYAPEI